MEQSRLRWQCRRGMRELDVLLSGWLDARFSDADEQEKAAFRSLLALSDPDLASYLLHGEPPAEEFANVVRQIRGEDHS